MIQGGGREVCANGRGKFAAGDNLLAHHVHPMEAILLDSPYFRLVLNNQAQPSRHSDRIRNYHKRAHHVVTQPVLEICLVGHLGIHQDYDVEAANLHLTDDLRET